MEKLFVESAMAAPEMSEGLKRAASEFSGGGIDLQELDRPIVLKCAETTEPLEEGIRVMPCRNAHLAGGEHPATGTPFELKIIEHQGERIQGVFAQFKHELLVSLPEGLRQAPNRIQFNYSNAELGEAVAADPTLASRFSAGQLEQIGKGCTPDGYVWHHAETPGEMQLVDRLTHLRTAHTGGQDAWGGGAAAR